MAVQRSGFEGIGMRTGDLSGQLSLFRQGGLIALPGGATCRVPSTGTLPVRIRESDVYRVPVSTVKKMLLVEEVVLPLIKQKHSIPVYFIRRDTASLHTTDLLEAIGPRLAKINSQIRRSVRSSVLRIFGKVPYLPASNQSFKSISDMVSILNYRIEWQLFKELMKMAGHPAEDDWS